MSYLEVATYPLLDECINVLCSLRESQLCIFQRHVPPLHAPSQPLQTSWIAHPHPHALIEADRQDGAKQALQQAQPKGKGLNASLIADTAGPHDRHTVQGSTRMKSLFQNIHILVDATENHYRVYIPEDDRTHVST